jgi:hypothetical protein
VRWDGQGDKELLMSLADHMGTYQQVMEMSRDEEMNALRQLLLRRRDLNFRWGSDALRRS